MPQITLKREQWDICGRCGSPYPLSQLVKQDGMLVCTVRPCVDDKAYNVEYRQRVISELLADGTEFDDDISKVRAGEDDTPRFF